MSAGKRYAVVASLVLASACGGEPTPADTDGERSIFATFAPSTLPEPPRDVTNRFADDPAARALGARLFVDTAFAGALLDGDNDGGSGTLGLKGETGKVACVSCHVEAAGFVDDRSPSKQISLAAGWVTRKTRSLLDVGHATLLMWDGRTDSLQRQALAAIESPLEFNSSRLYFAEHVFATYREEYEAIFGPMPALDDASRFPPLTAETTGCGALENLRDCATTHHGVPGDEAEYDAMSLEDQAAVTAVALNAGKALGAHLRTLTCGPGRFDAWVHGDEAALDEQEREGAELFVGRAGCAHCHSGPFFTDEQFHNVGLPPAVVAAAISYPGTDYGAAVGIAQAIEDPLNSQSAYSDGYDGRLPDSVGPHLEGAFRTPGLRCAARRPSFMHSGQLLTLDEVVDYFADGGPAHVLVGTNELSPVELSESERDALVAFIRALDPALDP